MQRLAPTGHGRCLAAPTMVRDHFRAQVPMSRPRPVDPRRARRLVGSVLPASMLVATGGARASIPSAAAGGTPHPLGDLPFYGRGYGHGVGMSQYGARGRALAGQLAPEILAHYYAGTTLGTRSAAAPVRVLLLTCFSARLAPPLPPSPRPPPRPPQSR